jgi:hypothetical protein
MKLIDPPHDRRIIRRLIHRDRMCGSMRGDCGYSLRLGFRRLWGAYFDALDRVVEELMRKEKVGGSKRRG